MNNFSVNKRTNSGFSMTFENGYTISVQWGGSTYSTNHGIFPSEKNLISTTAEVAVMCKNKFVDNIISENPCGYRTAEEVATLIYKVSLLESSNGKKIDSRIEESEEKS